MATLDRKIVGFIVEQLALGDSYTTVANTLRDEQGVSVTRQHVRAYDPTVPGRDSEVWKKRLELYNATRENFLHAIGSVPSAHRAVRIRRLERMSHRAEEARNFAVAAQLLEQIAKEVGDVYTNSRQVAHTGSVTIEQLLAEGDDDDVPAWKASL